MCTISSHSLLRTLGHQMLYNWRAMLYVWKTVYQMVHIPTVQLTLVVTDWWNVPSVKKQPKHWLYELLDILPEHFTGNIRRHQT